MNTTVMEVTSIMSGFFMFQLFNNGYLFVYWNITKRVDTMAITNAKIM
jgi:hypothetical protein